MGKFTGRLGYLFQEETSPGVWEERVEEYECVGDIISANRKWEKGESFTDELNVSNRFSIVAAAFVTKNLAYMRYLKWMDVAWKITNADIQYPRIILTIGGVYNVPADRKTSTAEGS